MKLIPQKLNGVMVIEPDVYPDERGFFMETYHQTKYAQAGLDAHFVQDNHSRSSKGVVRGLHFQTGPFGQGKLVRVVNGAIFDVVVDINKQSETYAQWVGVELSSTNHKMLYVPPDYAHGFCVLEDQTDVLYKVTSVYHKEAEGGVVWNDPTIGIEWPKLDRDYLVSEKDRQLPLLESL